MKTIIGALAIATVCATGAVAQRFDPGLASASLREDMTEAEVSQAIGYRPNKVELGTCGSQSTHGSWPCKKFRFGQPGDSLTVIFRKEGPIWLVNSWYVVP